MEKNETIIILFAIVIFFILLRTLIKSYFKTQRAKILKDLDLEIIKAITEYENKDFSINIVSSDEKEV